VAIKRTVFGTGTGNPFGQSMQHKSAAHGLLDQKA